MRRKDAISIRVRGPSKGLVTRLPSDEADQFRPADRGKVSVVGSNVRYEKGVIASAPGYQKILQHTAILEDSTHHWSFDEAIGGVRKDSIGTVDLPDTAGQVDQVEGKFKKAALLNTSDGLTPRGILRSGAVTDDSLSFANNTDFTFTGWVKFTDLTTTKTLLSMFAGTGFPWLLEQVGGGSIRFTNNYQTSPTLLRFTLTSSATLSTGVWYFIAVRTSGSVTTLRVNSTVDTHVESGGHPANSDKNSLHVGNSNQATFAADSYTTWSRALSDAELDVLYNSGDGLDYPFNTGAYSMIFQGNLIADFANAKPVIAASNEKLWSFTLDYDGTSYIVDPSQIFSGNTASDKRYGWSAQNFYNRIIAAQHDNNVQQWFPTDTQTFDLPGLPAGDAMWDGVEVFFGHTMLWKQNRLKWSDVNDTANFIPISTTVSDVELTIDTGGFAQPSDYTTPATIPTVENPTTAGLVVGQFIRILDTRTGPDHVYTNYYVVNTVGTTNFTATLLNLTDHTPFGDTIAAGQLIFSLIANEAGEANIIGADFNGPIYRVLAQGDYAYVFKERSIHSVQYVGRDSGTFFVHPEIANEGLLSRTSLLGLGDGRMIFVGHREIYMYTGGPNLTPICQQVSREFYASLDRTRLEQIVLYHNEFKNEIWIHFPTVGGSRVLVWNYFEDTATYDDYDALLGGISALAAIDWSTDPTWNSLDLSLTWDTFDPLKTWDDLIKGNLDRITVMALGNGELFVAGVGFNRNGEAYTMLSESMDYDFGDPDLWKYVEVVPIGLQVKHSDTTTHTVYVQIGARASLDQPLGVGIADRTNWTAPLPIQVQGNFSPSPIKVNPGGAGRFIRIRFYSVDADVEWAITSFEIHARAGAYY